MNCANHPDREHTAFCQNCGKPICQECTRVVGTAVFCEPCLAARLSGAGAPSGGGSYTYTGGDSGFNYTVSGTASPNAAPPHTTPANATRATSAPYTPPPPNSPPPPGASWSTPSWDSYVPPPIPPYGTTGYPGTAAYPGDPNLTPVRNRFPAGAIWLIGLGCLFLIGNSGLFHTFPVHRLVPFFLIGLGVWLFVRRMTDTGTGIADDGTPGYQFRLFRALRGSVWVTLIVVLFLLDSFDIVSCGHSWPIIIIVAGLMAIFQRVSYNSA